MAGRPPGRRKAHRHLGADVGGAVVEIGARTRRSDRIPHPACIARGGARGPAVERRLRRRWSLASRQAGNEERDIGSERQFFTLTVKAAAGRVGRNRAPSSGAAAPTCAAVVGCRQSPRSHDTAARNRDVPRRGARCRHARAPPQRRALPRGRGRPARGPAALRVLLTNHAIHYIVSFAYGIGVPGGSTTIMESMPPGKMS